MSRRTPTITVALTLAAGVLATHDAVAQRTRDNGSLYQVARPHYDDWTMEGFRDLDQNRDGRITAAEWTYDREDFRRADHNGDGVLSQREFLGESTDEPFDNAADGARYDTSATDARFADLDTSRDNRVSRSEWREDRASFDRLDENRDGYLTRAEMAAADDDGVDDFATMDVDRNGVVTRGEWPQTAASFQRLDTNRDGRLTSIELAAGRGDASTAPAATQSAAYRAGYERGLAEGRAAGREDRARRQGWDVDGQRELEQADSGYRQSVGARTEYQAGYRAAFRVGYREGFGPR
jgi:EF hand